MDYQKIINIAVIAHVDAGKADLLNEPDREDEVHRALDQGEPLVLLKDARSRLVVGEHGPLPLEIEIHEDQGNRRRGEHPAIPEPDPDEGRQEREEPRDRKAVDPGGKEAVDPEEKELPFF